MFRFFIFLILFFLQACAQRQHIQRDMMLEQKIQNIIALTTPINHANGGYYE